MNRPGRLCMCLLGGLVVAGAIWVASAHWLRRPSVAPTENVVAAPVVMDDSQREQIWSIEHHGLLLSKKGFANLGQALAAGRRSTLVQMLAANFTGAWPQHPTEVKADTDYALVQRLNASGDQAITMNRNQFADALLKYRRFFDGTPVSQFALMTFTPVKPDKPDGPWEGMGQLRLVGKAKAGNPAEVVLVLRYRTPKPSKPRLRKPGWLLSASVEQIQTARARRGPLLQDVARAWGVAVDRLHDNWQDPSARPEISTGGVYLCDYNRDGILDMLVTDVNGIALYQGRIDNGTFHFVDVTAAVGLPTEWSIGQQQAINAFVDVDNDGWEDLLLGGTFYRNVPKPDAPGGRGFEDYSSHTNLHFPPDASSVVVADYDRDGRLDLYVTRFGRLRPESWLKGTAGEPGKGNQLWHNTGNWHFEDVTAQSGTAGENRSTFSAVWLDTNNDGWPDLYIINEFGDGLLFVNRHDGTFASQPLADRPTEFGAMGVTCGDIDNDGNIDLYSGNMYSKAGNRVIGNVRPGTYPQPIMDKLHSYVRGSQLWRNRGGLHFEPEGQALHINAVGWSYGPALVDLDNDGFLDIYATCGFISHSRTEPDG